MAPGCFSVRAARRASGVSLSWVLLYPMGPEFSFVTVTYASCDEKLWGESDLAAVIRCFGCCSPAALATALATTLATALALALATCRGADLHDCRWVLFIISNGIAVLFILLSISLKYNKRM